MSDEIKMPDTEIELISAFEIISEMRSCSGPDKKEIIILDCRSANDFASSHIKTAANISMPTIMLRRLKEGKIDLFSTIKCKDLKNRLLGMDVQTLFCLYHNSPASSSPDIIQILSRKLMAEFNDKKIRVVCLAGEYESAALPFLFTSFMRPEKFSFIKSFFQLMAQLEIGFINESSRFCVARREFSQTKANEIEKKLINE